MGANPRITYACKYAIRSRSKRKESTVVALRKSGGSAA